MARIFISYSRSDRPFIDQFVTVVKRAFPDHELWFDDQIHGGADWWNLILQQINRADIFIYLISDESLESPYCQAEFREARRLRKPVLPVIVRRLKPAFPGNIAADLAPILRRIHYIDFSRGMQDPSKIADLYASISRLIAEAIADDTPPRSAQPIAEPPVLDEPKTPGIDWQMILAIVGTVLTFVTVLLGIGVFLFGEGILDREPAPTDVVQITTEAPPTNTPEQATTIAPAPTRLSDEDIRATGFAEAVDTLTASAPTDTPTITLTPSNTPISSSDIQNTARAEAFASATVEARRALTDDAIARRTAEAQQTQVAIAGQTATRAAVLSLTPPTNTPTDTPTDTPTLTPTDTPEPTSTNTRIAISVTLRPPATPDPIEQALAEWAASDQQNDDWTPRERTIDGAQMMLVPPGSFQMGSTEAEIDEALQLCNESRIDGGECSRSWFEDERPNGDNTQTFDEPFWIDRHEVSRADYDACVDAGVCTATPSSDFSTESNQPINRVTLFQAETYCNDWRNARLPSEAEWEYAARGSKRLIFPWGPEFDDERANHCDSNCGASPWASNFTYINQANDDEFAITAPVDHFETGASWVGALNLSGNVWEWTHSIYGDYPYDPSTTEEQVIRSDVLYVLRGGSFGSSLDGLRAANRLGDIPGGEGGGDGFRCARSFE